MWICRYILRRLLHSGFAASDDGGSPTHFLDGSLGDWVYFERVLTAQEVSDWYGCYDLGPDPTATPFNTPTLIPTLPISGTATPGGPGPSTPGPGFGTPGPFSTPDYSY